MSIRIIRDPSGREYSGEIRLHFLCDHKFLNPRTYVMSTLEREAAEQQANGRYCPVCDYDLWEMVHKFKEPKELAIAMTNTGPDIIQLVD